MARNKDTRMLLLQSARQEFVEKGYMRASLRNICRNAGVTTGALYFFFEDKEDLFISVTKETIESIYGLMQAHFQKESDMAVDGAVLTPELIDTGDDFLVAAEIIHQMYVHREDVLLVLTGSQGSRLEHLADEFIETAEKHYCMLAEKMRAVYPEADLDERFIHWLAHEQIDAFIYMITHLDREEDGLRYMRQAITYMISGWFGLFQGSGT